MTLTHHAVYDDEQRSYRQSVRRFVTEQIAPHFRRWEDAGIVDRELWHAAGSSGYLLDYGNEEIRKTCSNEIISRNL